MHRTLVQYVGSGWRRAGLLLAIFFPFGLSLVSVPEVFAKVNSTQFPWRINLGYLPFTWENQMAKSNGSRYSVREALENMACD